jgi:hypothetical protein
MLRKLSLWVWSPGPCEYAIRDVARELRVSEYARLRAELDRLVAAAYARKAWDA